MILSNKNKYIYMATPHTGSSAISKELCEKYGGKPILHDHANYFEFFRVANKKQRKYFAFASIRNPLDEATSIYAKLNSNHHSDYTNPKRTFKKGGWVTKKQKQMFYFVKNPKNDFNDFLIKFYKHPYTSNINTDRKYCNFIARFEYLEEDFTKALKMLNIKKARNLPVFNKTKGKKHFTEYYSKKGIQHALKIFGPFMEEFDYKFPKNWPKRKIKISEKVEYFLLKKTRYIYCKWIKTGPFKKILSPLREKIE